MSFPLVTLLSHHLMTSKRRFISFDNGGGRVAIMLFFAT